MPDRRTDGRRRRRENAHAEVLERWFTPLWSVLSLEVRARPGASLGRHIRLGSRAHSRARRRGWQCQRCSDGVTEALISASSVRSSSHSSSCSSSRSSWFSPSPISPRNVDCSSDCMSPVHVRTSLKMKATQLSVQLLSTHGGTSLVAPAGRRAIVKVHVRGSTAQRPGIGRRNAGASCSIRFSACLLLLEGQTRMKNVTADRQGSPRGHANSDLGLASHSKINVQTQHLHTDRSAISVVAWVIDVLQAASGIHSAPKMRCVVRFEDILSTVTQSPVTKQKPLTTQRQIFTVRRRQPVGHDGDPKPIQRSIPQFAAQIASGLARCCSLRCTQTTRCAPRSSRCARTPARVSGTCIRCSGRTPVFTRPGRRYAVTSGLGSRPVRNP